MPGQTPLFEFTSLCIFFTCGFTHLFLPFPLSFLFLSSLSTPFNLLASLSLPACSYTIPMGKWPTSRKRNLLSNGTYTRGRREGGMGDELWLLREGGNVPCVRLLITLFLPLSPRKNRDLMPDAKLSKQEKEAWQASLYSSTTMESLSYSLFVCNGLYLVGLNINMHALLAASLSLNPLYPQYILTFPSSFCLNSLSL